MREGRAVSRPTPPSAPWRRRDGAAHERWHPVRRHEDVERGGGRAAWGSDVAAQGGGIVARGVEERTGAGNGRAGEAHRDVGREARGSAGLSQRLDEVEDVGRPAARDGGDGVDVRLRLDPDDLADGSEERPRPGCAAPA